MCDDDSSADNPAEIFRAFGNLYSNIIDDINALKENVVSLEAQNQGLEERLSFLLAERTKDRVDLFGDAHIAHLGLAAEYHSLVVQWMQRVARKLVSARARPDFELALGQQVSAFTECLFRDDNSDVEALISSLGQTDAKTQQLVQSMCDRAVSLQTKISEIGIPHEWDFRTETSGALDDERQEAWLTCDPSMPVRLVVAPAYVVQGQVYSKQLVVTSP